jgi:hypothetical protein
MEYYVYICIISVIFILSFIFTTYFQYFLICFNQSI